MSILGFILIIGLVALTILYLWHATAQITGDELTIEYTLSRKKIVIPLEHVTDIELYYQRGNKGYIKRMAFLHEGQLQESWLIHYAHMEIVMLIFSYAHDHQISLHCDRRFYNRMEQRGYDLSKFTLELTRG